MLAGVGCSAQSTRTPSADDEIKSFVAAYSDALNQGSAQQRWDMTCTSQHEWFNANPVRKEQLNETVPGHLEIKQITANGDTATVAVDHINGDQHESVDFHLVRENGSWKVCEK